MNLRDLHNDCARVANVAVDKISYELKVLLSLHVGRIYRVSQLVNVRTWLSHCGKALLDVSCSLQIVSGSTNQVHQLY